MILQEIFKNNLEVFIPEFYITTIFLTLLLFGTFFQRTNNNRKILIVKAVNNINIYLLFILLILTYNIYIPNSIVGNGLFITNELIKFIKIFLIYSTVIFFFIQQKYILEQKIVQFENTILILISLFGLLLLVSTYHLISLYLAIELQSLCFYILTASQRKSILSAEAALKYFILGAIASSFILFGSSILYGITGSLNLGSIFLITSNINNDIYLLTNIIYGSLFILVGIFFKVGIVPFHQWLPDVYEGSPNNITAFFAIIPKIAFVLLLLRFFFDIFYDISYFFEIIIYICSFSSILIGSLMALQQKKFKRLLAYSSISHIGFILMGFVSNSIFSVQNILFYIIFYTFMSITMWTFYLSLNINFKPIKYLSDLTSSHKTNIVLLFIIILNLFSMAGIPPLAGFFSKMFILQNLLQNKYFGLAILGVLISAIGTFYYIRLIKIIFVDKISKKQIFSSIPKLNSFIIAFHSQIIFLFFIYPDYILTYININSLYFLM